MKITRDNFYSYDLWRAEGRGVVGYPKILNGDLVNYSPPPPMVPCCEYPPYKERNEQLSIYDFCTLLTISPPIETGGRDN